MSLTGNYNGSLAWQKKQLNMKDFVEYCKTNEGNLNSTFTQKEFANYKAKYEYLFSHQLKITKTLEFLQLKAFIKL